MPNTTEDRIPKKSKNAGRPTKISLGAIREIKTRIARNPCITAWNLKKNIPQLQEVSIRTIQSFCKEQLKLPGRKMVDKPLLTERMQNNRLKFARQYAHWGVKERECVMCSDESHFELRMGN